MRRNLAEMEGRIEWRSRRAAVAQQVGANSRAAAADQIKLSGPDFSLWARPSYRLAAMPRGGLARGEDGPRSPTSAAATSGIICGGRPEAPRSTCRSVAVPSPALDAELIVFGDARAI